MRRMLSLGFVCVAAIGGTGCATIVHGPRQNVTITSDPSGAAVTVLSGQTVTASPGVTPLKVRLPRRDRNLTIRLEKDGCEPKDVPLKRGVSGWIFGNLIAANPYAQQGMDSSSGIQYAGQLAMTSGMVATDFLTGGAYTLPKVVDVRVSCSSPARSPERF